MWGECAIVDDNKFDRLICKRIVNRIAGEQRIVEFDSAETILKYLEEYKPGSGEYVLFLDLNLAGMGGLELLKIIDGNKQFEAIKEHLIVHVMTSSTRSNDKDIAATYDFVHGYIQKPISIDKVTKAVEE